jgi:hypothetical protein
MKKIMLGASIVALAMIANISHAQNSKDHGYTMPKMGIKGGVSLMSLSNLEGNQRVTAHAGIFVHNTINKNWCFQPELLYSAQGQKYVTDEGEKRVLALDYIQAPFMMQYFPAQKFYLEFGPQVGLLVNSKTKNAVSGDDKIAVDGGYHKVDVGLNAGLGVNFTDHFGIYGRYTQGLVDVTKSSEAYKLNTGVQLGAAVRF